MHSPPMQKRWAKRTLLVLALSLFGFAACTNAEPVAQALLPTDTLPPPKVAYSSATNAALLPLTVQSAAPSSTATRTPTLTATFTAAAPVLPTSTATLQALVAQAIVAQEAAGGETSRTAILNEIINNVVARLSDQESFETANEAQVLGLGGQVQTDASSTVRIDLSEGSILRLDQNSFFTVTALEPAEASPLARLFLSIGRIFIVLTGDGSLEVETPVGIASVRGSAAVAWYIPPNEFVFGCGAGDCSIGRGEGDGFLSFQIPVGQLGTIVGQDGLPQSAGPIPQELVFEWLRLAAEAHPELAPLATQIVGTATAHAATLTAQPTNVPTEAQAGESDSTAPTVTNVNSSADTGDGQLDSKEPTNVNITQLTISFSEGMNDPAGDTDDNDVTNPGNYTLVKDGGNRSLESSTCNTASGDDSLMTINSVTYDSGTNTATLNVNGGTALPNNLYRVIACGTATLKDSSGNALDGNGDGSGGDNFSRDFAVSPTPTVFTDDLTVNGNCTLREAITAANTNAAVDSCRAGSAGNDLIVLLTGTYNLSVAGTGENNTATGDLDIKEDLDIFGQGAGKSIVDGNAIDRVFDNRAGTAVDFQDLTITDGKGSSDEGAGIRNNGTSVSLMRVTVSANTASGAASGKGGGIYNASSLTISQSTISGNTAENDGGGIFNTAAGTATIQNSTISGNKADDAGGGIFNAGTGGVTNISYSTIASNTADDNMTGAGTGGGGIKNDGGTVNIDSSIVADNTDNSANSSHDCTGSPTSGDYNHIEDITNCGFTASTNDTTGSDPALAPLANNGGNTLTHLLNSASGAINTIPNGTNGCGAAPFAADQRASGRPQGGSCDKGAVESQ